eukprot:gene33641-biopygen25901
MGELLARLRAALRRAPDAPAASPTVEAASFRLDLAAHRAFTLEPEAEVRLTPTEWAIVTYLTRNPQRLVTHRQF